MPPTPAEVVVAKVELFMTADGNVHCKVQGQPAHVLGAIETAKILIAPQLIKQLTAPPLVAEAVPIPGLRNGVN